ncbi:MAG TPA: helix-turn-helix domain-containing protein [bacterium]|jgi:hypothetical protein|nr:helix-turn-helix domain-containing protein [bacterium]HNZ51326.1 helix-turn-helix domain-containing protein [bacterium]HOF79671.1 helix-turn-helix domain-containing protein [bacterium]HOH85207.1 helix-turn-helix domain-containing protein [bacterium]HOQ91352.1 helix-turn-helix domain-containing protein [bacterium]
MSSRTTSNFGSVIKDRRLAKNWSVLFCARRLKIKPEHIRAIEDNNFDHLPVRVNLVKVVVDYLQMLGFSAEEAAPIIDCWRSSDNSQRDNFFGRRLVRKRDLWSYPQIVRNSLVALAILVAAIYIVLSLKNIVAPPKLLVTSPAGDLATNQKQLWIVGQTEPEVQLEINGETLLSDRVGNFSQLVNLRSGINNLSITAVKKYGGRTTIVRQVMVTDN